MQAEDPQVRTTPFALNQLPDDILEAVCGLSLSTDMVVASRVSQKFRSCVQNQLARSEKELKIRRIATIDYETTRIYDAPKPDVQLHPLLSHFAFWLNPSGSLKIFDFRLRRYLIVQSNCDKVRGRALYLSPKGNFICLVHKAGAKLFRLEISPTEEQHPTEARLSLLHSFEFNFFLSVYDCKLFFDPTETQFHVSALTRQGRNLNLEYCGISLSPGQKPGRTDGSTAFGNDKVSKRELHRDWYAAASSRMQLAGAILFPKGIVSAAENLLVPGSDGARISALPIPEREHGYIIFEPSRCGRYHIFSHPNTITQSYVRLTYWDWRAHSPYRVFHVEANSNHNRRFALLHSGDSRLSVFLMDKFVSAEQVGPAQSGYFEVISWTVLCLAAGQMIRVKPNGAERLCLLPNGSALTRDGEYIALGRLRTDCIILLQSAAIYATATGTKVTEVELDGVWPRPSAGLSLERYQNSLVLTMTNTPRPFPASSELQFHLMDIE